MTIPRYKDDAMLDRFLSEIYQQERRQQIFNDYKQECDYERYEAEREAAKRYEVIDDEF